VPAAARDDRCHVALGSIRALLLLPRHRLLARLPFIKAHAAT